MAQENRIGHTGSTWPMSMAGSASTSVELPSFSVGMGERAPNGKQARADRNPGLDCQPARRNQRKRVPRTRRRTARGPCVPGSGIPGKLGCDRPRDGRSPCGRRGRPIHRKPERRRGLSRYSPSGQCPDGSDPADRLIERRKHSRGGRRRAAWRRPWQARSEQTCERVSYPKTLCPTEDGRCPHPKNLTITEKRPRGQKSG